MKKRMLEAAIDCKMVDVAFVVMSPHDIPSKNAPDAE